MSDEQTSWRFSKWPIPMCMMSQTTATGNQGKGSSRGFYAPGGKMLFCGIFPERRKAPSRSCLLVANCRKIKYLKIRWQQTEHGKRHQNGHITKKRKATGYIARFRVHRSGQTACAPMRRLCSSSLLKIAAAAVMPPVSGGYPGVTPGRMDVFWFLRSSDLQTLRMEHRCRWLPRRLSGAALGQKRTSVSPAAALYKLAFKPRTCFDVPVFSDC